MNPRIESGHVVRLEAAARRLAAAVAILGCLVLVGLVSDLSTLKTVLPGLATMNANTAMAFVLSAVPLALRRDIQRQQVDEALRRAHDDLEAQVQQRTGDLRETVHALQVEADGRRRVEQALRESERRYRQLVDSSRGLICTHDLDGTLLSVNPAAAQLLGYTSAELVGRNLRELLDPTVRDQFLRYLEQIREAPANEGVMRLVTRAGERRLWAYSNVRCEEPGRPPYVLGHAQDITALKRAEHLAREAEALRSVAQLANAAAHEINNPLTVVAGHLDMLQRRGSGDPGAVSRIEKALAAVDRIRTIIESMGRITRLERLDRVPNLPPQLDLRRSAAPAEPPSPPPT